MLRRGFFFFERMRIPRRERVAFGTLLVALLFFRLTVYFMEQKVYYDKSNYQELEEIFRERTKLALQEREELLRRYEPVHDYVIDSVPAPSVRSPELTGESEAPVDINHADIDQLQQLPGIGPAYARRIVEWRDRNGAFHTAGQLLEIRGIGPARLEAILPWIEPALPAPADLKKRTGAETEMDIE